MGAGRDEVRVGAALASCFALSEVARTRLFSARGFFSKGRSWWESFRGRFMIAGAMPAFGCWGW